jgi:hypothetical protein
MLPPYTKEIIDYPLFQLCKMENELIRIRNAKKEESEKWAELERIWKKNLKKPEIDR